RSDDGAVAELARRIGTRGGRIQALHGDAGDPGWCEEARKNVLQRSGRLDLLVLNACEPPAFLQINQGDEAGFDDYIRRNLRLVRSPIAACLKALEESGGAIVCVSSSFVDESPAGFGHYVALKQAAEGLVRTASREGKVSAFIARPPRLQTAWNDTPTGV